MIGIDEGRIILDKAEMLRNGSALHIDQGIAVTSHASQAKTVDQVIVSVPFARSVRLTKRNSTSPCRGVDAGCSSSLTAKLS